MGFIGAVTDWCQSIWRHKVTAAVVGSLSKIVKSQFTQLYAGFRAGGSILTHPPTQRIAKHFFYVAVFDLGGLVALTYLNEQVQNTGRAYLGDDRDYPWFSLKTGLQASLASFEMVYLLIYVRGRIKLQVRTMLINLDSPALSQADSSTIICDAAQCATMDYLKGSLRDFSTFWATEMALLTVEHLDIPGATQIAFALRVHHNGRYIVTVAKSARCYDHQLNYLKENPETAFALGLGHAITSFAINSLLQWPLGLSSSFYYPLMQLMLIPFISVASHMELPDVAVVTRGRTWDPIAIYQERVDWIVKIFAIGIEHDITMKLKEQNPSSMRFSQFLRDTASSGLATDMARVWQHPLAQLLLPSLLHNANSFRKDTIVHDNWPEFITNFVTFLKAIEDHKKGVVVQVASALPGTSLLIHLYFGVPEAITKLLLKLINDQAFMEVVSMLRYRLENLQREKPASVTVNQESLLLNGFTEPTAVFLNSPEDSSPLTDVNDVIRRRLPPPSSSPNRPENVIRLNVAEPMGLRHRMFHHPVTNDIDYDALNDGLTAADPYERTNGAQI